MPAYYLTEQDVETLSRLLEREGRRIGNVDRQRSRSQWDEHEAYQTPEVYVAFPATPSGLDGLEYVDKAYNGYKTTGSEDVPGEGECDIYAIQEGKLVWIERTVRILNVTIANLRDDWLTVKRTKFGDWIAEPLFVAVDGLLDDVLEAADSPLTGATFSRVRLIEWSKDVKDGPATWTASKRTIRLANRSVNFAGQLGTYGVFAKLGGELRVIALDCDVSEEGVHAVLKAQGLTIGGSMGDSVTGG